MRRRQLVPVPLVRRLQLVRVHLHQQVPVPRHEAVQVLRHQVGR